MPLSRKFLWISLVSLLAVSVCHAEEPPVNVPAKTNNASTDFNLWLSPGFISYHFNRDAGYRERNWGVGIQSNMSEEVSVLAGNYINSTYTRSNYVGLAWQPLSLHSVKVGLAVSAFDGYLTMRNGNWFAAILPLISFRNEWIGANLTFIPDHSNQPDAAIAGQLILRIW